MQSRPKTIATLLIFFLLTAWTPATWAADALWEPILAQSSLKLDYTNDSLQQNGIILILLEGMPVLAGTEAATQGQAYYYTEAGQALANQYLEEQQALLPYLSQQLNRPVHFIFRFTAILNGFCFDGTYEEAEMLKNSLSNPKIKEISFLLETDVSSNLPQLFSSTAMLGTSAQLNKSPAYTGQGQIIAIIDSEFDIQHELFAAPPNHPHYSQEHLSQLLPQANLALGQIDAEQVYHSAKIPFAYDYGETDLDVFDNRDDNIHGSHVAGIASGSHGSAPDGSTISGVAPDSQLLLMKISRSNGFLSDAAIIAATEDAVKLGASTINMSFGSPYGTTDQSIVFNEMIDNIRNAGVTLCVAMGNEGRGYNPDSTALRTTAPDYAAIGFPALAWSATAVASINNLEQWSTLGKITTADGTALPYQLTFEDSNFAEQFDHGQAYSYVDCHLGRPEDLLELDLTGKFALVQRGEIPFVDKAANVKAAGAIGLILYNYDGDATPYLVTPTLTLPTICLTAGDGQKLCIESNKQITIYPPTLTKTIPEDSGQISSFSSWGIPENLDLKPEITAPGGMIYSSVPDSQDSQNHQAYSTLSGTSMAAPHITGIMALLQQFLEQHTYSNPAWQNIQGKDKVTFLENLLMSSADPVVLPSGLYASPRLQGAGVANFSAAIATPVILTSASSNGKTKIILSDQITNHFTLTFDAHNLTNQPVTYDQLQLAVQTDGSWQDEESGLWYIGDASKLLYQAELPAEIVVPANGSVTVNIPVQLDKEHLAILAGRFPNGFFVDGFVLLDQQQGYSSLQIPFAGFRGAWEASPIFDSSIYAEEPGIIAESGNRSCYLFTLDGNDVDAYPLGINLFTDDSTAQIIDKKYLAISPNQDHFHDLLKLDLSTLRHYHYLNYQLLDENGQIQAQEMISQQNAFLPVYGKYTHCTFNLPVPDSLPDGSYTIQLTASGNYTKFLNQTLSTTTDTTQLPLTIDRQPPLIEKAIISSDQRTLTIAVSDNHYVQSLLLDGYDDQGQPLQQLQALSASSSVALLTLPLKGYDLDKGLTLYAVDYAMNQGKEILIKASQTNVEAAA